MRIVPSFDCDALGAGLFYGRTGVSPESITLGRSFAGIREGVERSAALSGKRDGALADLERVAQECSAPDWDGEGALPVDRAAVGRAERFIRALPASVPVPEIAAEPDGSVSLDWRGSQYRMFSISVGRYDRLSIAWLKGTDSGHAVARFDGWSIPDSILDSLRTVLRSAHAAV